MVSHPSSLITKTHILESALRCLARHGYEAAGLRQITGRAQGGKQRHSPVPETQGRSLN